MEETFEKIAQEAVEQAERVECPFLDFKKGLRTMLGIVKERYEQACEEARSHERMSE